MAVDHAAVIEGLKAGESQNAVARRLGCSVGSVNRIAKLNAIPPVEHPPQPKTPPLPPPPLPAEVAQIASDYALEQRIALLNKVFAKAESMIDTATTPHKLQAMAIAVGILIDKRRLEDGEVTARTEVSGGDARERLARSLDELAARRRASDAA